jgi:DnaJ-class molecular chaperone
MGKRIATMVTKLPKPDCGACQGFGTVRLTAHFRSGDQEWEAPCWECFGSDVRLDLPKPRTTDN